MTSRDALATEQSFFSSLVSHDIPALEQILSEDFLLVDVVAGNVIPKYGFLGVLESKQLTFEAIERVEADVREYGDVAVVVGRTEMSGTFAGEPFSAASRYTHVFFRSGEGYQLVSAQGTQIQEEVH